MPFEIGSPEDAFVHGFCPTCCARPITLVVPLLSGLDAVSCDECWPSVEEDMRRVGDPPRG